MPVYSEIFWVLSCKLPLVFLLKKSLGNRFSDSIIHAVTGLRVEVYENKNDKRSPRYFVFYRKRFYKCKEK